MESDLDESCWSRREKVATHLTKALTSSNTLPGLAMNLPRKGPKSVSDERQAYERRSLNYIPPDP
ncbi:hypothetical protein K443DRAFT_686483 [Laccaria amethystina LaAM-08-1]|uniref:Uncharacterized protein n=1 Tax=Laccaria amethystina LaAM-08-1 TaxID=1095629 RepID=A0A0C9WH96_9AGAR|nr:hypothetical protein K443DRAFT_686483 [Laccaria amethystina LaAM-08-1]